MLGKEGETRKMFIDKIAERLTEDDKKQLSDIYEPTVVAIPDENAWGRLTVLRDGRIRFYGDYKQISIFDHGEFRCYKESCDGGLSWKKHTLYNHNTLGHSVYIPFMDRYIMCYGAEDKGVWVKIGTDPDDESPECIEIPDTHEFEPMPPVALRSRNRVIFVAHERRKDIHPSCYFPVVFYSDDNCRTWVKKPMEPCPFFAHQFPDQGVRWQQNNRENSIVELSDGSLYMIARTANNYHYETYSHDGGETWEPFKQSVFHSSGTMPHLCRLSDGRIVFLWCNTKMMPEFPEADGIWEDVFTNRDANHCAISSDEGKTWQGYRELFLNPIRYCPDFRANGGPREGDKSVHQFEALELPMNKLLVAFGQHEPSRRLVIFDIDWLYEHSRTENLLYGFKNLSTQNYLKSILGGYKVAPSHPLDFVGHCAANRVSVTVMMPSPENNGKEALHITRSDDDRLVSGIGGAVWNFPIHKKGTLKIKAHIPGKGLRVSLLDYWMNPSDSTVQYFADFSIVLTNQMQCGDGIMSEFVFDFDCDKGTVIVTRGDYMRLEFKLNGAHPNGLCYLHMQSAATEADSIGTYVAGMTFAAE